MKWWMIVVLAAAFWAAMIGLLIDREIIPYFEYQSAPSYETMLGRVDEPVYRRFEVLLGADPIGEGEEVVSFQPGPLYRIENRVRFNLKAVFAFMPVRHLTLSSQTDVNLNYELTSFRSTFSLGGDDRLILNAFRNGEKLDILYNGMTLQGSRQIDFPEDMMLSHNLVPYHGNRFLAVGLKWTIQMIEFDFLRGEPKFVPMYVSVEEKTRRTVLGREEDVYRVEIKRKPTNDLADYSALVMKDGSVVESVTTFGKYEITTRLVEQRTLGEAEFVDFPWAIPLEGGE